MAFFLDRGRNAARDRWLLARVRLFAIGAALALGGMALDDDRLVLAALAVLGSGLVLRVVASVREAAEARRQDEEDPESETGNHP
jgi:Flp pilus assembly protein TadB